MPRRVIQSIVPACWQAGNQWPTVKRLLLCILSALLLILSFPSSNIWLFAWFGFVPLFLALQKTSKHQAFFLAYFTGVIFWSGIIYWLAHVTLLGTIILILYLSLYFGVFGLLLSSAHHALRTTSYLFFPSLWVMLEYLRSYLLTGFPWALLGYSQYLNLPIIQIADITGVWGVSFLVMAVNIFLYRLLTDVEVRNKIPIFALLLFIILGYGAYKIQRFYHIDSSASVKVAIVQGNIPQEVKWDPEARSQIVEKYARLTNQAALSLPDLIIWPEASSPGLLGEDAWIFEKIFALCKTTKVPLLLGAVAREDDRFYNSAILVNAEGKISCRYNKLHLVPFGEYIPLKKVFPFLETIAPIGDITPGKEYTIFDIPPTELKKGEGFGVLICFEDLFPELSRRFVGKGARLLVNITNDAWYKQTSAPFQHLQASVFRAVENRTPLVRSANTGVSCFIDPKGRIISYINDSRGNKIFVEGTASAKINLSSRRTIYNRLGDFFILICCALAFYGLITRREINSP